MNLKMINELLKQNNLTMNDINKLAKKFEKFNFKNEADLRIAICEIASFLGKEVSLEEQQRMIETLKKGDIKL